MPAEPQVASFSRRMFRRFATGRRVLTRRPSRRFSIAFTALSVTFPPVFHRFPLVFHRFSTGFPPVLYWSSTGFPPVSVGFPVYPSDRQHLPGYRKTTAAQPNYWRNYWRNYWGQLNYWKNYCRNHCSCPILLENYCKNYCSSARTTAGTTAANY